MEEAAELGNYLPLSFKSPKEQEYIEFLWDAFETNYTHGKYQFAFLAYHMLTMSFVYFNIWQIKHGSNYAPRKKRTVQCCIMCKLPTLFSIPAPPCASAPKGSPVRLPKPSGQSCRG